MDQIDKASIENKGFITKFPAFNDIEFEFIRKSIDNQYKDVLKKVLPKDILKNHFRDDFNVSRYHDISKSVDHPKTWYKLNRVLNKDFADWFLESSYIAKMKKEYGRIEITDEECLGYPNIYWRLVRPKIDRDVGSLHRDSWFWDIDKSNGKVFPEYKRLKSWISISVEPGKNGLLVVPESHIKNDIKWSTIQKDGGTKPILSSKIKDKDICLLDTKNNTVVIFDDNLLHGGSKNNGHFTRVSLEFTLFLK
tara:strand:- start:212 stop:964 length:753 start_codon:yes stop_codon:yes gene_type:complete